MRYQAKAYSQSTTDFLKVRSCSNHQKLIWVGLLFGSKVYCTTFVRVAKSKGKRVIQTCFSILLSGLIWQVYVLSFLLNMLFSHFLFTSWGSGFEFVVLLFLHLFVCGGMTFVRSVWCNVTIQDWYMWRTYARTRQATSWKGKGKHNKSVHFVELYICIYL